MKGLVEVSESSDPEIFTSVTGKSQGHLPYLCVVSTITSTVVRLVIVDISFIEPVPDQVSVVDVGR